MNGATLPNGQEGREGGLASADSDGRAQVLKAVLNRFEAQIHLPALLLTRGFQITPVQSDPGQLVMTSGFETLHLRKDLDRGGWTYTNPSVPSDRGTVVDFMISRDGSNLETCLNRLGGCAIRSQLSKEGVAYHEALQGRGNNLHAAEAQHIASVRAERDATRSLERMGIDRQTLEESRFGPVRTGQDVEALFRNPETVQHSRYRPTDKAIVFVERPVDAVAYEKSQGRGQACYVYTGDDPGSDTKRKIAHLLAEAPHGMKVVLAFGRGDRGDRVATNVAALVPGRTVMERRAPVVRGRWYDQLQLEHRHKRSLERSRLSLGQSRGM